MKEPIRVIQIVPKDVHVTFEISLKNLDKLMDFLDGCEFIYDKENEKQAAAKQYVENELFPFLDQISEDLNKEAGHGTGSNSAGS